ncbi:MAG: septum site-determining protein MinC [Nevskiaceae bacterium]|nr:MAG: septum site-determining protein MinC [Nevskiaceae bacterium]TBR71326.1 MAG: septum site-determining protein MinC [Nevskiaceae bacterium]
MPADATAVSSRSDALSMKGRTLSVTRVRVLRADATAIGEQLKLWAARMPQAVRGMAAVIDSDVDADLPALLKTLREVGMQPLAVSEGPLAASAAALGLAVVSPDVGTRAVAGEGVEPARPKAASARKSDAAAAVHRPARIVTEPVRSGQQIYAKNADLVVLSHVSAGAELVADGCVHVYGRLSGRAIAGASGDETARVFCARLEAELLAVAGIYAVAEQMKEGPRGAPAQAWLENGRLRIEKLA